MVEKKWVYLFEEGNKDMKEILGGKGANLAEMASMGIPVPPGFTLTTEVCKYYNDNEGKYPEGTMDLMLSALKKTEEKLGKKFGDKEDPLLFSVRSGAFLILDLTTNQFLVLLRKRATKDLLTMRTEDFFRCLATS